MKLALYLCIITMEIVNLSTQNRNISEGLDEILDKLIKQAEKGTDGVIVDKVEQKDNDSKVIYLKTNDSHIRRSPIDRSTNDIKKLIQENADNADAENYVSDEIIIEMKEEPNEEIGSNRDIINKFAESDVNMQARDQIANSDLTDKGAYFPEIKEETVIEEMLLDKTINEDNQKNMAEVLKDMFELPSAKLVTNHPLNGSKKQATKNLNSKLSLRTFFPNVDAGHLRSGFTENRRPTQKRLPVQFYPFNYERPIEESVQSIITKQLLSEMVHSKVTQSPNYFQYFMPTIVTPVPNVLSTVIHQRRPYPPAPYNWQAGTSGTCCIF